MHNNTQTTTQNLSELKIEEKTESDISEIAANIANANADDIRNEEEFRSVVAIESEADVAVSSTSAADIAIEADGDVADPNPDALINAVIVRDDTIIDGTETDACTRTINDNTKIVAVSDNEVEATKTSSVEEENTILLPEPDKQLVENFTEADDNDEQVIAIHIKTESTNATQSDVLAEPLDEGDNLYAANIEVKSMENVSVKVEAIKCDNDSEDKNNSSGIRRRTTRKSAVAAAAAIRFKLEPSPEPVLEACRTRSKRFSKSPICGDEKSEKKKRKRSKFKTEKNDDGIINAEDDSSSKDKNEKMDINRCRICLSKDTLISIFSCENSHTVAEKIMNICNSIKIHQKDQLPQYVCNNCVQSVNVAFNLKALCEKTDKELKSKLIKIKFKKRRPINKKETNNCKTKVQDAVDESPAEDKENDDEEFIISNESGHSVKESDTDSDFDSKRKRNLRRKKTVGLKKRVRSQRKRNRTDKNESKDDVENGALNEENVSSNEENNLRPSKKKRSHVKSSKTDDDDSGKKRDSKEDKNHVCAYCDQKFPIRSLLREHKKTHIGEKPFICNICNKPFKLLGSYKSHQQKHKEEDNLQCSECKKHFPTKTEYKKHMIEVHGEQTAVFVCDKCKRAFTTQTRLEKHKDGKCPGFETPSGVKKDKKKNSDLDAYALGRDLFKCVAPMTTTYWSDSFSD